MSTRAAVDLKIYQDRLLAGSLAVGRDPPLDSCVKQLVQFQKALLSDDGDRQSACDSFCEAIETLEFHIGQTRHAGPIAEAETAAYLALQGDIKQLQQAAREEIALLKKDLTAAYQTHLNKDEYEVRAHMPSAENNVIC